MRGSRLFVSIVLLSLGCCAAVAQAQPYAQRSLTLPDGALRIDAGTRWPYPAGSLALGLQDPEPIDVNMGLSAGIAPGLELGAVFLPVRLRPDGDYGDPGLHLLYRFGGADQVQTGLLVRAEIPVQGDFDVMVGVPVRVHAASAVRLDLGGFLAMTFAEPGTFASLLLPVEVAINVTEQWFLGPLLGINVYNVVGEGDATTSIPFSFFAGHSWGLTDLRLQLDLGTLDDEVRATRLSLRVDLVF